MQYRVTCYGRKVGAIGTLGTDSVVVEVSAADECEARSAAIDAVYTLRDDLEHISPRRVELMP